MFLDEVSFGDARSELEHAFDDDGSLIDGSSRRAVPLDPPTARLGDLSFTIAVVPDATTYLTLEFSGDDDSSYKTLLLVNGEQASYRAFGDHEPINSGTRGGLPGRQFFSTVMLPPRITTGASRVRITLRTYESAYRPKAEQAGYEIAERPSRRFFRAMTHVDPVLPGGASTPPLAPARPRSIDAEREFVRGLRRRQIEMVAEIEHAVDAGTPGAVSISRYRDGLRFYADSLRSEWTMTDAAAGVRRVVSVIDHYVREYFGDVRLVGTGGHQSDWGGYYAALGEALYIVEPLIEAGVWEALLDERFDTGTVAGEFSIAASTVATRREAWELALKANFDFARSRLSYIFNQVMLTYEGAWKAHEGLRIVGSRWFEGTERSHAILRETYGLAPFLGEEILVGLDGEQLDLEHSLFHHDKNAEYTDDVVQVVLRGRARTARDDEGMPRRRRPYGAAHRGLSHAGLTRENGYVGAYGELIHWLAELLPRLRDHPLDVAVHDDLLRAVLLNHHARGVMRYQGIDEDGHRAMLMEQVIDDRNSDYPGRVAYGSEGVNGAALVYAGIERHLAAHRDRYAGPEWDAAWEHAREAAGWAQQMLVDGQYVRFFDGAVLGDISLDDVKARGDLHVLETWEHLVSMPGAGAVLPHTDLAQYSPEELALLGVSGELPDVEFADVDTLVVSLRRGARHLFASLVGRNIGFTGVGRAHIINGSFDQLLEFETHAELTSQDVSFRGATREAWRQSALDVVGEDRAFAWIGEAAPVAFQPGIGVIERDGHLFDTPYSARGDLVWAQLGDLVLAMNTTSAELGNARRIPLPLDPPIWLDPMSAVVVEGHLEPSPHSSLAPLVSGDWETATVGSGAGFAGGDDARLGRRFLGDSLRLATRPQDGDVDLRAVAHPGQGLIVRDELAPLARYVAVVVADDGTVEVRTRSLDTREDIGIGNPGDDAHGGITRSPFVVRLPSAARIRLVRHAASHEFVALVSEDGLRWERVWMDVVPMPLRAYVGSVSLGADFAEQPAVEPVPSLLATVGSEDGVTRLRWNKPPTAYVFRVVGPDGVELERHAPQFADLPDDSDGWRVEAIEP